MLWTGLIMCLLGTIILTYNSSSRSPFHVIYVVWGSIFAVLGVLATIIATDLSP